MCGRLPDQVSLDTAKQVDDLVLYGDGSIFSDEAFDQISRPTTSDESIAEAVAAVRDPVDKAAFNRINGKLRPDIQLFRRRCWKLVVTLTDDPVKDHDFWRIPVHSWKSENARRFRQ